MKKVRLASHENIIKYQKEVDRLLELLGYPNALVTDLSLVSDLCRDEAVLDNARTTLGVLFSGREYIWKVAEAAHDS